jgi:hypothetical protein
MARAVPKKNDMMEASLRLLREVGATDFEVSYTGGGHLRLAYRWRGKTGLLFMANTASDWRAIKGTLSFLKRQLRGMGVTI